MSTTAADNATSGPTNLQSVPETMTAVVASRYGSTDQLEIKTVPVPTPKDGELLVRVEASSVNALDWHFLTGTPYVMRLMVITERPRRTIYGADVAGTVVAVGSDVTDFAPGDEVFGECEGGGFGEYLTVDASHVVPKPADVSFEAAGATPVAGLTAVQGLRSHADVQPGEHVLINGAAGGVGTFAVQVALALGAEVTAVCSGRNVEMVRALGATTVIDYEKEDFVAGGARFDVMLDNVGNRSAKECLSVLNPEARYVAISGPKENRWVGPIPQIAHKAYKVWRSDCSFHQFTAAPNVDDLNFLGELLSDGRLVPQIQRSISLDGIVDALNEVGTGHTRAKIVVRP